MHRDSGLAFEYSFERDSACSYLVLRLDSDIKLLNHQAEIISQNPAPAFVPFHIRRENENISIYYNITSRITLAQYLERKRLNRKEILDLLRNITRNLMLHRNYLLELSSFIIHQDFIYINPATAEVSLVYVPVHQDRDIMEAYREFLKDMLVNSANIDENSGDNFLQRILNFLRLDTFNLNDFNRLIIDLRNGSGAYVPLAKSGYEYNRSVAYEEASHSSSAKGSKGTGNKAHGMNYEGRKFLSIILIHLIIVLAAAIACLVLVSRSGGDMASIAGVLIIAAAIDILAVKKMGARYGAKQPEGGIKKKTMGNQQVTSPKAANVNACSGRGAYRGRNQAVFSAPEMIKACDTVMVSGVRPESHPYLEGVGVNAGEKIIINKGKFIIGRLSSMVDYVIQESTIGKLHAEITENMGVYCIRDLNSKNGTYVNDVRIPSNKEYEIKINDRIRFSNLEYVFRQ